MDKDVIPETVTINFSQLPEDMQKFHVNTAKKSSVSLGEQLLGFIKTYTEKEQELGRKKFREEAKAIQEKWKEIGVSTDIPFVREQFDTEDNSQE